MALLIVLNDKHGPHHFRTYCGALRFLRDEYYVHEDNPRLITRADAIIESDNEWAAMRFMTSRRSHEYEDFYTDELFD